ncbi:MAG: PDZ domain-containing protein, partial [Candidatus Hydrogenedentes bacterium]|nr:PDZ domain-containing protein [Candidatus Hydrogenedentota bacterium]
AAYDAEIMEGDIITEIQQKPVTSIEDFRALVTEHALPGKSVMFRVQKFNGQTLPVLVKVPEDGKG